MASKTLIVRSLQLSLLLVASSFALAQAPVTEKALATSAADPQMKWGPCPAPLPKGCQLAVLHGDPAQPNADVFLKLPGASKIPMHTHTSAERMMLVQGKMQVTYEGQKKAVLTVGSYAYGPAKLAHTAACVSRTPCILFIAFEQPVDINEVATAAK